MRSSTLGRSFARFSALLALMPLAVQVGCGGGGGGGGGGTPGLGLTRIAADTGRSAKAALEPATGGTVTATGADGTVYSLVIPPDALLEPTEVAVYPVNQIQDVPFDQGLAAAAHFTPEGLQLAKPATLTITLPAPAGTAALSGFSYEGDAADLHLYPMQVTGQTLTLQVSHFSGAGAGRGTRTGPGPATAASNAETLLRDETVRLTIGTDALAAILRQWYVAGIKPDLQLATTDAAVTSAVNRWVRWRQYVEEGPWSQGIRTSLRASMAAELSEAERLAVLDLRDRFLNNNFDCRNDNRIDLARTAMRFWSMARAYGLARAEYQLDRATILGSVCYKVIIDASFAPTAPAPGQGGTLKYRAGYQIGDNAPVFNSEMAITIIPTNAVDNTVLTVNYLGSYNNEPYTRNASGNALKLHLHAHFKEFLLADVEADKYMEVGADDTCNPVGTFQGTYSWPPNGTPIVTFPAKCVVSADGQTLTIKFFRVGGAGEQLGQTVTMPPFTSEINSEVTDQNGNFIRLVGSLAGGGGQCDISTVYQDGHNSQVFNQFRFAGTKSQP